MPTHRIIILPEMEGRSIRSIALGCIGMSSSQFKRAKFEGCITLDGVRATADVRPLPAHPPWRARRPA